MWIVKYQYFEFTLQWGKALDILLKYLILNSISLYYNDPCKQNRKGKLLKRSLFSQEALDSPLKVCEQGGQKELKASFP